MIHEPSAVASRVPKRENQTSVCDHSPWSQNGRFRAEYSSGRDGTVFWICPHCDRVTTLSQPGVPHRSPARPTGSVAAAPRPPVLAARDGSIFPFGRFSGTIRLWRNDHDAGGGCAASSVTGPAGKASRSLAALLDLWPARPLRDGIPGIRALKSRTRTERQIVRFGDCRAHRRSGRSSQPLW